MRSRHITFITLFSHTILYLLRQAYISSLPLPVTGPINSSKILLCISFFRLASSLLHDTMIFTFDDYSQSGRIRPRTLSIYMHAYGMLHTKNDESFYIGIAMPLGYFLFLITRRLADNYVTSSSANLLVSHNVVISCLSTTLQYTLRRESALPHAKCRRASLYVLSIQ